jgi:hypothetical protein
MTTVRDSNHSMRPQTTGWTTTHTAGTMHTSPIGKERNTYANPTMAASWSLLVTRKDGSTNWAKLKDIANSNPIEMAEYVLNIKLNQEPAFSWWSSFVLQKRDRIISKVKSKYWGRAHKYGIEIPKSMDNAKRIDAANGNTLWQDVVQEEMAKINPALDNITGTPSELF